MFSFAEGDTEIGICDWQYVEIGICDWQYVIIGICDWQYLKNETRLATFVKDICNSGNVI